MKKILSFFLCASLLFSLSACTQKDKDLGDKFIMGTDNQYYINVSHQSFAESQSSYYLFGGNYLFAKDKQTGELTVLCDKPDCLHDYESDLTRTRFCNAFFMGVRAIQYSDNKLYILSSTISPDPNADSAQTVYEVDVSGSNRKELLSTKQEASVLMVHRGYFYLSFSDFLTVSETSDEDISDLSYRLERYPLKKPTAKPEVIYSKNGEWGQINSVWAYGNQIYWGVSLEREGKDYVYNLQTKKVKEFPLPPSTYPTIIDNQLLYFPVLDSSESYPNQYLNSKAVLTDLSGKPVDELEVPFGRLYSNSNYIISDNYTLVFSEYVPLEERKIQIYDKNGEFMKDIFLHNSSFPAIGMNEDYYFYLKQSKDENNGAELWAIDLNKLDNPNLEGEKFFAYESPIEIGGVVFE